MPALMWNEAVELFTGELHGENRPMNSRMATVGAATASGEVSSGDVLKTAKMTVQEPRVVV